MMKIYKALGRLSLYINFNNNLSDRTKHILIIPILRLQQIINPITDDE